MISIAIPVNYCTYVYIYSTYSSNKLMTDTVKIITAINVNFKVKQDRDL